MRTRKSLNKRNKIKKICEQEITFELVARSDMSRKKERDEECKEISYGLYHKIAFSNNNLNEHNKQFVYALN